jgi:hypothetical protein
MQILIFAAMAGFALDDMCPTPPRWWPGPRPGPWPWWVRKILAVIGGIGAYEIFSRGVGEADLITVAVVAGVGGIVLASLGGALAGSMNRVNETPVSN